MSLYENTEFITLVREHFVAITVQCARLDDKGQPARDDLIAAYSAFVIEICGVWCLVTAGHVISDPDEGIEGILKNPRLHVRRIALVDFFNRNAITKKPTPFTYEDHHKIHIDQEGVDIGIIPLRDFYRHSLTANGVRPLPCALWDRTVPACDDYVLVGTPVEHMQSLEATEMRASGLSVLLALVPLQPRPMAEGPYPRFAAELLDGGELKSVKGMSGGPIIGVRKKGLSDWEYACLAVQAIWHGPTRIIFGTPVGMIVTAIKIELAKQVPTPRP